MSDTNYREHLRDVAEKIVDLVLKKDKEYGASWKKRGGISAGENLYRKLDRLDVQMEKHGRDIFKLVMEEAGGGDDTLVDVVGYALLILAERQSRRVADTYSRVITSQTNRMVPRGIAGEPVDADKPNVWKCGRCGRWHLETDDCPLDPGPAHP